MYNTVTLHLLVNCRSSVVLTNTSVGGIGWCNENLFLGGAWVATYTDYYNRSRYGVVIRSEDGANSNNRNVFIKPSFEMRDSFLTGGAEAIPVHITHGTQNDFLQCRTENSATGGEVMRCDNTSNRNVFGLGYDQPGAEFIGGTTTRGGNRLINGYEFGSTESVFECADLRSLAAPYSGNADAVRFITSVSLGDDYVELVSSSRAVCLDFKVKDVRHIEVQMFCKDGYLGKQALRLWDADDVLIQTGSIGRLHNTVASYNSA